MNLITADTEEIHVRYMYLSAGASIWYIDESVFPLCYHTCLQSEGMEPRSCKDDTLVHLEMMLQVLVHLMYQSHLLEDGPHTCILMMAPDLDSILRDFKYRRPGRAFSFILLIVLIWIHHHHHWVVYTWSLPRPVVKLW